MYIGGQDDFIVGGREEFSSLGETGQCATYGAFEKRSRRNIGIDLFPWKVLALRLACSLDEALPVFGSPRAGTSGKGRRGMKQSRFTDEQIIGKRGGRKRWR